MKLHILHNSYRPMHILREGMSDVELNLPSVGFFFFPNSFHFAVEKENILSLYAMFLALD